ncbi:lycopene cyclase domain-containing protein [Brachybacterium endophyticum]|uniref:Lycopene cyclase domain-containing protein n=1 Tax=Brachybacterium endophyticum TaxID=2182385 RepID=A0A2U2RKM4_9MICO|nr:lycopene cyclase domain-containing protein [Brachybacterium endophyticum]PWH06334.1 lycopene cyclase domain-containing protein [Brachybacterium endophyticum]
MHGEYLIVLGLCLLITLPLEFVIGARVYRRPRRLLAALAPTVLVFLAWDYVGIHRGHWWYAPEKISGITLPGGMPLEELLFFLVIPICGLLTLEAVQTLLAGRRRSRGGPDA